MVVVLPWFLPFLSSSLRFLFGTQDIYNNALDMTIGLSAFHTAFNLINALILMNFTGWLTRVASIGIADENSDKEQRIPKHAKFLEISGNMPEMATMQLQKETQRFGEIIHLMGDYFKTIINTTDSKKQSKLIKKIKQYEEITDKLEIEITEYITKLSKEELTARTSLTFRSILTASNELERIADLYLQLAVILNKKIEENIYFLPEQRERINEMISLVDEAQQVMNTNLSVFDYSSVKKQPAMKIEKNINQLRDAMRTEHLTRLGAPDYNVKSAMVYNNVFLSLERIGDHIMNVTESVVGEI
jgi:phosphate:Na+ symporter